MSEQELKELADDIRKNGLQQPIVLCHRRFTGKEPAQEFLIDGRNRLDALALLGWLGPKSGDGPLKIRNKRALIDVSTTTQFRPFETKYDASDDVIYHYVISANIQRRHLTAEQKRDLIAELLKVKPEQSNRSIAKQVKVDHKTVAASRSKLESTGEIPQLEKTVGADGKSRKPPSSKSDRKARPAEEICADINDATKGAIENGIEFVRVVGAFASSFTDEFLDDAATRDELRAEIRWAADEWTKLADKLDKIALTHSTVAEASQESLSWADEGNQWAKRFLGDDADYHSFNAKTDFGKYYVSPVITKEEAGEEEIVDYVLLGYHTELHLNGESERICIAENVKSADEAKASAEQHCTAQRQYAARLAEAA